MVNENIYLRRLEKNDMNQVILLLQSLSNFQPKKSSYGSIWNEFAEQKNVYSLVAIVDHKVVGYGCLLIETKIRGGRMGHIEDIVTHSDFERRGIGKQILEGLYKIAKEKNCYKLALQCSEHNVNFYEKCNYKLSGLSMQAFL